jgi:surface polysaccharide O-acyltransferase-like enzyme
MNAKTTTSRLCYLDWLRVLALLGVFLFHATAPFADIGFNIENAEQSLAILIVQAFLFPWGMPFFFLIAGASAWLALQRRTPGQYARERFSRLLIPFVVGSLLLSPVELYLEWSHKIQMGVAQGSFLEFVQALAWGPTPRIFGVVGYHLWFVGFLFCYSLLTLPLFRWLKGKAGQGFVSRLAALCQYRGGILLFILPLLPVRLGLHAFFPYQHDWADFCFLLAFFTLGYVLFADRRFTPAIRRDWPIMLAVGIAAFVAMVALSFSKGGPDIEAAPRTLVDFTWWGLVTVCSWCWTIVMLFVGMRFLDFSNRWLQRGQEAVLPFYVLHQPVIFVVAFFAVQWEVDLLVKLLAVVLISFAATVGIYALVIKRVSLLQTLLGMKVSRGEKPVAKVVLNTAQP